MASSSSSSSSLFPASRRSPAFAFNGMVATSQSLATQVGLRILQAGGNAADAAVAVAATLNVTEPCSTGIGGDAFLLYYDAATKRVRALNGSGRSPAGLTLDIARTVALTTGKDGMDPFSVHCVTVPGACALWVDAARLLGRLDLAQLLAPAIDLARQGFPVGPVTAVAWAEEADRLLRSSPNGGELLQNGRAPDANAIMRLPALATTFEEVAKQGKDGFYRGRIAEAIIEVLHGLGSTMTLADLAEHATEEVTPISVDVGDLRVYECPPNGQGITALIALKLLEFCPSFAAASHNSADYVHLLIEALRLAFADTRHFVADPAKVGVPVAELLDDHYLHARARLINPAHATANVHHGTPVASSDTVYFCVVDSDGNACSFINSNYMGFGSAIVPRGCGFSLQNRGANFSLQRGHANVVAPHKRPYHTIIPALVTTKTGELVMPYGVMGSWMQPQGHVQVFYNMIKFGMDPQQALDVPRICLAAGAPDGQILLEEGLEHLVPELVARGHTNIKVVTGIPARLVFGKGQVIHVRHDAVSGRRYLVGGSDPRGDGAAFGL